MRHMPYVEWYQNSMSIPGSPAARHHAEANGPRPYEEWWPFVDAPTAGTRRCGPTSSGGRSEVRRARHEAPRRRDAVAERHAEPVTRPTWAVRRGTSWATGAGGPRAVACASACTTRAGSTGPSVGCRSTDLASMFAAIPQSPEYLAYADAHWRELIERCRPDVLWNDIAYPPAARPTELFADFYNGNRDGVVNNRFDCLGVRAARPTPTSSRRSTPPRPTSKGGRSRSAGDRHSFGYNARRPTPITSTPTSWCARSSTSSPTAATSSSTSARRRRARSRPRRRRRLDALGWWLRVNGEAIYGTRPADRVEGMTGCGLPVRSTARGGTTYAIVLGAPSRSGGGARPAPRARPDRATPGRHGGRRLVADRSRLPRRLDDPVRGGPGGRLPRRPALSPASAGRHSS